MDRFVFYSKSKDCFPGTGRHELLHDNETYESLSKLKHWRRRLSNFDTSVNFQWNGHTWRSIEHAFQGTKISIANKTKGYLFTLDSKSNIGESEGNIAQKNRKLVKLDKHQLTHWDKIKDDVMKQATIAKYNQAKLENSDIITLLKLTKNAELHHLQIQRGKPSMLIRFKHLEYIRDNLLNNVDVKDSTIFTS